MKQDEVVLIMFPSILSNRFIINVWITILVIDLLLIIKQMSVATNNQTTKTELFAEIVNGLEPFTNFRKKLHHRCSIELENR